MIKTLFHKLRRFITYGLVGCINSMVDFLAFTFCHSLLHLSPEFSQAIGYASGITSSFLLNRNLTFRDGKGRVGEQFIKFICVNGTTLTLSVVLISIITEAGVNPYLAKVVITASLGILNYLGNKIIVFRVQKGKGDDD
jgi:putative flippase GtrA